jgi:preprotein translocase subunit SecF
MWILKNKKIFYSLSITLVILSVISIFTFGLRLGIDFTGGSVLEFQYLTEKQEQTAVEEKLNTLDLGQYVLRSSGENGYTIKTETISDSQKEEILSILRGENVELEVSKFSTIGPTLGNELKSKATVALVVVIIAIIFFIAFAFRHVSKPVSSWKYGFVAIIALIHDVLITLGFFALLGGLYGKEIDTLFVTALLVILGYSINDTIVVLDRVRENLKEKTEKENKANFEQYVGKSLKETFARSINTSITTLLALIALFLMGGSSTSDFALALIVGVIAGAYSSLFLAAPLLVTFKNKGENKK